MKFPVSLSLATTLFALVSSVRVEAASPPLWPAAAPGEKGGLPAESDTSKPNDGKVGGRAVIRTGNVSTPTLTVYSPPAAKNTGAAVLVCPGGGYNILALDLEGTEVCEWLNSIGVTGVLLKYRVPKREGLEKHTAALQDAQRAMGVLRSKATELGLDPKRIGVLGFSAGGHLAAALAASGQDRSYPKVDAADDASCRPDFSILIYPAYLTNKEQGDKVSPEVAVTPNTPPTFIAITEDDPVRVEGPLHYTLALKESKVPVELHVYPVGGHGYGLRESKNTVTTWPARAADWLRSRKLLERAPTP